MEIIVTPSAGWLERATDGCRKTIDVSSPFVGNALCDLLAKAHSSVGVTLLTRTRLVDFASGASDINAVATVAAREGSVLGLDRLHAKIYVFDEKSALVTSANATYSGLRKNAECGVAIDDPNIARDLALRIRSGFASTPSPTLWSKSQLLALVSSVERLRARLPTRAQVRSAESEDSEFLEMSAHDAEELLPAAAGWTQLVFRRIVHFGHQEFTTEQALQSSRDEIARRFPRNRHPREKVRQQLQVLRDLGLIQFLSPGRYRLLIGIKK